MRFHNIFICSILALSGFGAAFGAEPLRIADLRFSVAGGKLGGYDANYTYTAGANSFFGSGFDSSTETPGNLHAYRLGYTGGTIDEKGGALFGISIQRLSVSQDSSIGTFDAIATGLQFKLAYGARLGENAHFEIGPFAGVGLVKVDDVDLTASRQLDYETCDGTYVQFGVELGAYVALEKRFVLGLFASIDSTFAKWDTTFAKTGGKISADADWMTLLVGAAVGIRF